MKYNINNVGRVRYQSGGGIGPTGLSGYASDMLDKLIAKGYTEAQAEQLIKDNPQLVNSNLPTGGLEGAMDMPGVNYGAADQVVPGSGRIDPDTGETVYDYTDDFSSLPIMEGQNIIPGTDPNDQVHNWYQHQGGNKLNGNGRLPSGTATKSFQTDMRRFQEKLKNDPNLQELVAAKYDDATLQDFMTRDLAGKSEGKDGLFGPTTTKAFQDFGSLMYDLKSQELSPQQMTSQLNAQDPSANSVQIDPTTNQLINTRDDLQTPGSTNTTPNSTSTTTTPTATPPSGDGNYHGSTYYTDGQWTTNWDPNSNIRYSTNPANIGGWDRVLQANRAQMGMNGQPAQQGQPAGNLYYQGMGMNPRRLQRIQNRYNRVANRMGRRGMRGMMGMMGAPMMQGQPMQQQGMMTYAPQEQYANDAYYGIQPTAQAPMQQRQPMSGRRGANRAFAGNRPMISDDLELERANIINNANAASRQHRGRIANANYDMGTGRIERRRNLRSEALDNRADFAEQRAGLDREYNDNLYNHRANKRADRSGNNLDKRYARKNQRIGYGQQQPQSDAIIDPQQVFPKVNVAPSLQMKQGFLKEGGNMRPKYQNSGTVNPNQGGIDFNNLNQDVSNVALGKGFGKSNNYFKSNFLSGNKDYIGLAMPDEAKFTDKNYQLPSYGINYDVSKDFDSSFDKRYIPKNRMTNTMMTSHQYGRSLANHLNDDPMGLKGKYSQGRRPSKGDFTNSGQPGQAGMYGQYGQYGPNGKYNSKRLGFGKDGLTKGDKLQVMGNYIPAMYNLGHAFIKPYPTMPAYNKYRYQVYNDMARQQTPKDYTDVYAMMNKGMRDIRNSSPNEQVDRANRLAMYNTAMGAIGKQKTSDFAQDRQMALQATQQLGQIGEHELGANEKARLERIAHEEARDNIVSKGVGQFGNATGAYGEALNNTLDNRMQWELMSQIYNKYGLNSYNEVLTGLQDGSFNSDDIVLYKKTGDMEAVRRQAAARKAGASGSNGKPTNINVNLNGQKVGTSTENVDEDYTNGGMQGSVKTNTSQY